MKLTIERAFKTLMEDVYSGTVWRSNRVVELTFIFDALRTAQREKRAMWKELQSRCQDSWNGDCAILGTGQQKCLLRTCPLLKPKGAK